MIKIIWPEEKMVSEEQLITWAKDDIINGLSDLPDYSDPEDVQDVYDAMGVLSWTGSVTFGD